MSLNKKQLNSILTILNVHLKGLEEALKGNQINFVQKKTIKVHKNSVESVIKLVNDEIST